jgi:diadenosine tetraphosphatase ApaH/serine/threonine PP2A family protein phosphatase
MPTDKKLKTEALNTLKSSGGIAIVSDIHANIDALGAVLTDIAAQRCFTIFCLGDTVGYGPEPAACIQHMREFASVNLMGNHEGMFIVSRGDCRKLGRYEFGELWPPIALCHRHLKASEKKWITKLPLVAPVADMTLVHGSLDQPHTFGYISDKELARDHFNKQTTRLSFYGHTHIPAIWRQKGKRITLQKPGKGPITLDPDCRYAIGVGSVGQPRDYDARACYVVYHPGSDRVEFRRIPYDIKRAQARFLEAGLSDFDAERIAMGS